MMWYNNHIIPVFKRTYYTLRDFLQDPLCGAYTDIEIKKARFCNNKTTFANFVSNMTDIAAASLPAEFKAPEVEKLWSNYIIPRMMDECIFYSDKEFAYANELVAEYRVWLSHFCNVITMTYSKYKALIDTFHANNLDLMADVATTSTAKFNDTPQAAQSGTYDWSDDKHLTNITSSENKTTGGTPIERLDEIRKGYDNIYRQWMFEFDKLFMEVLD